MKMMKRWIALLMAATMLFSMNVFGEGGFMLPNALSKIEDYAFYSSDIEGELKLPDHVESVGESAFAFCMNLTDLKLSANINTIGKKAFLACVGLTGDLTLPDSLTSLGESAFENCVGYDGILTINSNLSRIPGKAFRATNFKKVVIPETVTDIADNAFDGYGPELVFVAPDQSFAADYAREKGFTLEVPYEGIEAELNGSQIYVKAGGAWTAYVNASWIVLDKYQGTGNDVITFTLKDNPGQTARTGSVTFLCGEEIASVRIEQTGANVLAETLQIDSVETDVEIDAVLDLHASLQPANVSNQTLRWQSSDTSIASVTGEGTAAHVTFLKEGVVTIVAATTDGSNLIDSVTFTVRSKETEPQDTAIHMDSSSLVLSRNETHKLTATIEPASSSSVILWSSSNEAVARVDEDGWVSAEGAGTATITAVLPSSGLKAECLVTVRVNVAGISLSHDSLSLQVGDSASLTAEITPADAGNKAVAWSSSAPAVAKVDAAGKVEAISSGNAVITARTADGGLTAQCSVTVVPKSSETPEYNPFLSNLSESSYAYCYTLSDGIVEVYTSADLTTRGTVDYGPSEQSYIDGARDELYLLEVGTKNDVNYAKVSYPTATVRRTAYVPLSEIVAGSCVESMVSRTRFYIAEQRSSEATTAHYVDVGDTVYLLAREAYDSQILYPVANGHWRIGWCTNRQYDGEESEETESDDDTPTGETGDDPVIEPAVKVSAKGQQFIKEHEALVLTAYNDGYGTVTIGWGHTAGVSGSLTITEAQAQAYLEEDLRKWENVVCNFASANGIVFSQIQFDALVSLLFNVGSAPLTGNYRLSNAIKNNVSSNGSVNIPVEKVWEGFATWHHAGGVDSKGLLNRRLNEARLFALGDYTRKTDWSTPSWFKNGAVGGEVPDGWVPSEYEGITGGGGSDDDGTTTEGVNPGLKRLTSASYATVYAVNNQRYNVYIDTALSVRGRNGVAYSEAYTGESDDIRILRVVKNAAGVLIAQISYPISGGRATAYISLDALVPGVLMGDAVTAQTGLSGFYDRPGGSLQSSWRVDKGDTVYLLSEYGGMRQIMYNSTSAGGWRIAWCSPAQYSTMTANASSGSESTGDVSIAPAAGINPGLLKLTSASYATVYSVADQNYPVYTDAALTVRGRNGEAYAEACAGKSDDIRIYQVMKNSSGKLVAYINYPISGTGSRASAYIELSALVPGTLAGNGLKSAATVTGFYDRPGGTLQSSWRVDSGDTVYLLSERNGIKQIMYSLTSGGWRIAWCTPSQYSSMKSGGTVIDDTTTDGVNAGLKRLTSSSYAVVYSVTDANYNVYIDTSLTTRGRNGTAYAQACAGKTDDIRIYSVLKNASGKLIAQINYPISGGRATAYIALDALVPGTLNGAAITAKADVSGFYNRPGGTYYGSWSIDSGDTVYLLSEQSGMKQIMYSLTAGGWRIAWCTAEQYASITGSSTGGGQISADDINPGLLRLTSSSYATVFSVTNTNSPVYIDTALSVRGRNNTPYSTACAGKGDDIRIYSVRRNAAGTLIAQINYPISGGRATAYIPLRVLVPGTLNDDGFTAKAAVSGLYQRPSGEKMSAWEVYKGDTVYVLSRQGSLYQIMYNSSSAGGWRIAWCSNLQYFVLKTGVKWLDFGEDDIPENVGEKRKAVIDHAQKIYNYTWNTNGGYILLYNKFPGVDSNGKLIFNSTPYVASGTVRGLPYTLSSNNTGYGREVTWNSYKSLSNADKMKLSNIYTYNGGSRISMAYGMSCATFVTECLLEGLTGKGLSTNASSSFYDNSSAWRQYITKGEVSQASYAKLQPGDYLWTSGHVMLVYSNNGSSITVIEQTPPDGTRTGCSNTKKVNVNLTYNGKTFSYNANQVCMQCDACKKTTLGTQKTTYSYSYLVNKSYRAMFVNY